MNNNPIGIFDSGVGGLSVWKEIVEILPNENIIYFADSANCPYGPRSEKEVQELSIKLVIFLLEQNCKIVVVACNTATAAAIKILREKFNIPFVGLEPAVKPAAEKTKTGKIGILATEGTFKGNHFKKTSHEFANGIDIFTQVGDGLVRIVEENKVDTDEALDLLKSYIEPMISDGIDNLVLGCTHYPFLCDTIKKIDNSDKINFINPAPAVAQQTKRIIESIKANNSKPYYKFYSNGSIETLKSLLLKISPNNLGCEFIKI